MRILALVHGQYGERIVAHLRKRAPSDWQIHSLRAPRALPPIVDEPKDFLPPQLPAADLILHLAETSQAAQLLPGVVELSGARAAIAPLDHPAWIPPGLRRQLERELEAHGAAIIFPEPFCSLTQKGYTEGREERALDHPLLAQFAGRLGRPSLEVALRPNGKTIAEVRVLRESPCGSTQHTAARLPGMSAQDAVPRAGLICMQYPCLASMQPMVTEEGVETVMHASGKIFNQELARALARAARSPREA